MLLNIQHFLIEGCYQGMYNYKISTVIVFSLLRRIKTYSRSTLAGSHFSDLAVIAMHYKERIPVEEVLETFIQQHPRRLSEISFR